MKKLLFFDIDGTLAYPGYPPSTATVEAIQAARRNGHKVFISTGRTMDSIPAAIASIGFDGGIFSSGGIIALNNQIVMQHFMGEAVVEKVLSILQHYKTLYTLETADGRFNSENGKELMAQIDFTHISKEMCKLTEEVLLDPTAIPLSQYTGQPIHKIAYYSTNLSIEQQLISELDSTAKVVPYHISCFPLSTGEISDYLVNKGRALKDVCNYLGVDPDHCIAFGDSRNDSEIILAAGLGVAMGNADEELKDIANLVCDRCENDGIVKTLHDLDLI